jgi:hypothetical protein
MKVPFCAADLDVSRDADSTSVQFRPIELLKGRVFPPQYAEDDEEDGGRSERPGHDR